MEALCRWPGLWQKQCALPFADIRKENFPSAHKIIIIIALHTQIITSPTYIQFIFILQQTKRKFQSWHS